MHVNKCGSVRAEAVARDLVLPYIVQAWKPYTNTSRRTGVTLNLPTAGEPAHTTNMVIGSGKHWPRSTCSTHHSNTPRGLFSCFFYLMKQF